MRYEDRTMLMNNAAIYKNYLKQRNVKSIKQYATPYFVAPTDEELEKLNIINHIWKLGDRYYKLSYEHYGDTQYWWIIAGFNQKPTEAHISLGEVILVPHPLEDILYYMGG